MAKEIACLLLRLTLGANIFLHEFPRLIGDHAAFAAYRDKQMHNAPCRDSWYTSSASSCHDARELWVC
jgi:hypothetical protein